MPPNDPIADFISRRTRTEPKSPVNYWLLILFALALLAFAVAKLGDGNAPELNANISTGQEETKQSQTRIYTVTFKFGVFSPTNLRIRIGDTVTFRNIDSQNIHITSQLNPRTKRAEFDSVGPVPSDSSFSYTFTNEGVFAYHNADDEREAGVIIVRAR